MPPHSLRVTRDVFDLYKQGKAIELRIQTAANAWLIRQMVAYRVGETLTIECGNRNMSARVIRPTEQKTIDQLSEGDLTGIGGPLALTRERLIAILDRFFRRTVDGKTLVTLAHLERLPSNISPDSRPRVTQRLTFPPATSASSRTA